MDRPKTPSKRWITNPRTWVLLTVAVAIAIAVAVAMSAHTAGASYERVAAVQTPPPVTLSVVGLGPVMSLSSAQKDVSANFNLPTYLPPGVQLSEIRGAYKEVSIIFVSQNGTRLPGWNKGVMIISIERDNTTYVQPEPMSGGWVFPNCSYPTGPTPPVSTYTQGTRVYVSQPIVQSTCTDVSAGQWSSNVTYWEAVNISGHMGLAYNPNATGASKVQEIDWWSNGVHFSIMGVATEQSLVKIAQSMNT